MLIVGKAQEYSLYFFSGGGTYVQDMGREKSPTVPTKSLWLSCLAIFLTVTWLSHSHLWTKVDGGRLSNLMLITAYRYLFDLEVSGILVMRLGA